MNNGTYTYIFNIINNHYVKCIELNNKGVRARKIENKVNLILETVREINILNNFIEDFLNFSKSDMPTNCYRELSEISDILAKTKESCVKFLKACD